MSDDEPIKLADAGVQDVLLQLDELRQRVERMRELLKMANRYLAHNVVGFHLNGGWVSSECQPDCLRCLIERELQQ